MSTDATAAVSEANGDSPVKGELRNLVVAFRARARANPDIVAVADLDDRIIWTWADVLRRTEAVASGLDRLGVRRGDAVALMLKNRPEALIADLGALALGATAFSVYNTLPAVQMEPILRNSRAKVIICEQDFLPTVRVARDAVPGLEHVVILGDADGADTISWSEVSSAIDSALDFEALADAIDSDDVATIIYTSGTSGPPKGAELTHRNLISGCLSLARGYQAHAGDKLLSWLPMAHMADRAASIYWPVVIGTRVTFVDDIARIVEALTKVRPNVWFSVPRLFEKLRASMLASLRGLPDGARQRAEQAVELGLQRVRLGQRGEPVPDDVLVGLESAECEVFSPLRARFGLDKAHTIVTGSAPLPREVIEFFHAVGLPVMEVYGMTETGTMGTVTPKAGLRIGAVGLPHHGVELKLAGDGEILIKHEAVMRGYRGDPELTAAAFTADGFFKTGDLGAWNEQGHLRLIGRKKDIIINAAGKNMSPRNIEEAIVTAGPLIGQVCVVGDGRPYNVALVVLDADAPAWAAQHGIGEGLSLVELTEDPRVQEAVQAEVDAGNAKLARVEQIKKFHIIRGDWLPSSDELTPTMKQKRNQILTRYAMEIDALYR
jgi:long-chain acyl-CoA synthetase